MSHPHFRSGLVPRFAARQGGFTLVELITVIVILGVLAAVALPRFADLGGQARAAKLNAALGSMKSAAALVKAQAVAEGKSCGAATSESVDMEGVTIALNHCYPQATAAAILAAANVLPAEGYASSGSAAAVGTVLTVQVTGASTPANCSFTYTSPSAANTAPVFSAPVTSGC